MFGVGILAGPQRAAHVSTEALPRGRTRSLRSSNQLMAPMAPTARNSRMPASFRTPMKISTAIAIRNARTGLSTAAAIIDHMAQDRLTSGLGRYLRARAQHAVEQPGDPA